MQMLIGGKYVDASDRATIAVVNPVTGKDVYKRQRPDRLTGSSVRIFA